ncbi:MAG: rRNA maturation RNase YbeY [Gammaproteobacteria bacterium]
MTALKIVNQKTVPSQQIAIDVQQAYQSGVLPATEDFQLWVEAALVKDNLATEMVIRIVDTEESQSLNRQYRNKNKPTNVLSFPFEPPPEVEINYLGDLVICAPIVQREAAEQGKTERAHWAHMVVHGVLHLQGYDHIKNTEAELMESLEIDILTSLNFTDPYN